MSAYLLSRPRLNRSGLERLFKRHWISKSRFCLLVGCSRMSLDRWLDGSEPLSVAMTKAVNDVVDTVTAGHRGP